MKLSKLVENLQEVLERNGDKECLLWADSADNAFPDAKDLIKSTTNKEWAKYLTDDLTDRQPLFVGQSIAATVQLWYDYEYQKDNAWIPFGLNEPRSDRKPAKFRVGSNYKEDSGSGIIRIVGKFRSPTDGNVYVAVERPDLHAKDPEIFLVTTEGIGDEYICECKNSQTFKYKALDLI